MAANGIGAGSNAETIAILHPGDMGAAVGARLRDKRLRVLWSSAGRSRETRERAALAGLEDAGTLVAALRASTIALSICPPHAALAMAREVAAAKYRGVYVDANAVSPMTKREIERMLAAAGTKFVDGAIIGPPPPAEGAGARLYLSGRGAWRLARVLGSGSLSAVALEAPVGAAAALKVCFAAWNKNAIALMAEILALAALEDVEAPLMQEWRRRMPDALTSIERVPSSARRAWRWVAEMEENAATFESAGLPAGASRAAAEAYRRLAAFRGAGEPPPLAEIVAALGARREAKGKRREAAGAKSKAPGRKREARGTKRTASARRR